MLVASPGHDAPVNPVCDRSCRSSTCATSSSCQTDLDIYLFNYLFIYLFFHFSLVQSYYERRQVAVPSGSRHVPCPAFQSSTCWSVAGTRRHLLCANPGRDRDSYSALHRYLLRYGYRPMVRDSSSPNAPSVDHAAIFLLHRSEMLPVRSAIVIFFFFFTPATCAFHWRNSAQYFFSSQRGGRHLEWQTARRPARL